MGISGNAFHDPLDRQAHPFLRIKIAVDEGPAFQNFLEMPQGFGARLLRVAPKIVQILLFLRRSQPAHRINGRANAIDGYTPLKPGNADRAVEDHHPLAAVHHKRGPARLHEMNPAFQPAGMAEPADVPPVIDTCAMASFIPLNGE